jgi:hypothetical protein
VEGQRDLLLTSQGQEVADRIVPAHEIESIRTTEEFMRSQTARAGGETAVPGFAETDPTRRLDARAGELAEDATPTEEHLRGFARAPGLKADELIGLVDLADPTEGESDMSGTDKQTLEERQAALEAREAGIAAKEAAFAEVRAEASRAEDAALLDALAKDGRIAPGLKPEMAAFMEALDAEAEVSFAEGKATSPRAWFRDLLLKQTKPLIDFSERAGGGTVPQIKTHSDITAAANLLVKQAEEEGRALSFAEAVREIADRMESDNA